MSASRDQDTEITLGTGKMLALFFGLVGLCAVFFALGFKMGKGSTVPSTVLASGTTTGSTAGGRPSALKPVSGSAPATAPDLAFYKSANQKSGASASDGVNSGATPASDNQSSSGDPALAPPTNGYYVQVAAVSRQEDGNALVDALKSKQYAAFSAIGPDKLYHVEVGPFADIKNAEDTRAKLINDGYNPILKK